MRKGKYFGYTSGNKLTQLARTALQTRVHYQPQKIRTQEYAKANRRVTNSFHTGTCSWELHNNSVLRFECSHTAIDLGVFTLDTRLHNARVAENNDGRGTDEPEEGS